MRVLVHDLSKIEESHKNHETKQQNGRNKEIRKTGKGRCGRQIRTKLELAQPSRELLEELAVACAKDPNPDNTFQYAFCLSKSNERSELRYAVTILDGLVKEGYEHQVDCMYGSATALYLLEEYDQARVCTHKGGIIWQDQ